jgi:hypothetical protein
MPFLVAPDPERITGIAVFKAELAPGLDNAVFGDIHSFSVAFLREQFNPLAHARGYIATRMLPW